ncbi:hypothetical protein [uncultured Jatrophihabitans sp.]|uniref:hypothetical protein n=1 Tax=uncultured Jatrophihabitans sp. TaxID=1610747 RepID=UPI0035CC11A3
MIDWQYVLVGSNDDHDRALAAALDDDASTVLVRTVEGLAADDLLRPDGSWHDTDRLRRITHRGDIAWAVPITHAEARRVVTSWRAAGRLHADPELDEPVPAELLAQARVDECAARLRAAPPLAAAAVQRVRGELLDPSGELAGPWLAGAGRLAVPVQSAIGLHYPDDIERVRAAFASVGAETLWAVSVADADKIARWGVPTAVEVPNEGDWLGAFGSVYFATGDVVLTTTQLDAVILQRVDHGVLAGEIDFVRCVLGGSPEDAWEAFAAYLRGESYRTPTRDLTGVAERYGPRKWTSASEEGAPS